MDKDIRNKGTIRYEYKISTDKYHAFTTPYSATAVKLNGLVRDKYKELQNIFPFPRHIRDELVFGYKRNKNLSDILVSSKLHER